MGYGSSIRWRPVVLDSRARVAALVMVVVLGLWAVVLTLPVEWAISPSTRTVFRLGPVSADVTVGQTFAVSEPFDLLTLPVRIGGPFGSTANLQVRVRSGGPRGELVAESARVAVISTKREFEMAEFRFTRSVPAGEPRYFELEIPRQTSFPVFVAAKRNDEDPGSRLFLAGTPGYADQDLAYQLLRRQSVLGRLPVWWESHRGVVVVGAGLLVLLHVISYAAVQGLRAQARHRLPHPVVLGLALPALLVTGYFVLLFFLL